MSERIISRRNFLQVSGAGVAGAALLSGCALDESGSAIGVAAQGVTRPDVGVSLSPFPLSRVTLLDGA
ncbi:MAG TPA: twin-arginine translocation signal domain-containing protein, partial [Kofleriaceae bacterium]